jgi:hypothetical protein
MAAETKPLNIIAFTAGAASAVATPKKGRTYLGIQNQSTTATIYIAFDTAAVAAATAGQITLGPLSAAASMPSSAVWNVPNVPGNAINIIASAAATPVTILE